MKKLLALLLSVMMCFTAVSLLTGCDDKKDDTKKESSSKAEEKLDYKNMTAEKLLDHFITDKKNVKLEEYTALLETYSNVNITEELELEQNITQEAVSLLRNSEPTPKLPSSADIFNALIENEAPQVRGIAMSYTGSLFGLSNEEVSTLKKAIENEKEPYVLKSAVSALANEGKKDPVIGKFLVDMSKNENPYVRRQSAYALGNTWSIGVDGAFDALITMMDDEEQIVREAAYKYIGKQHNEDAIAPLEKILKNDKEAELHDEALNSLETLWYDYPFHEQTSEKAYRVEMDYLKTCPRNETTPPWISISSLKNISESKFDEYKANAKYYDADEIVKVMQDIVANPDVNWLGRNAAVDVIAAHGTKKDLEGMKSMINGLKDDKANFIQKEYEDKLKEKK